MAIHNLFCRKLFHSLLKCVESNEVKTMINILCMLLLFYITFVYIQCIDVSKPSVTVFVCVFVYSLNISLDILTGIRKQLKSHEWNPYKHNTCKQQVNWSHWCAHFQICESYVSANTNNFGDIYMLHNDLFSTSHRKLHLTANYPKRVEILITKRA